MNKTKLYITTILLASVSLNSLAQKKDSSIGSEVVNVIGTYTPTISDAFKVKETPSFEDETLNDKEEINYSILSFPVASTFTPNKGSAANVERTKKEKFFSNYASLGIGNYGTVLGELYLSYAISNNQFIGGMLKHHSSQGGVKDVVLDDFFYDTSIDLTYATQEKDYSWNADVGFRNQIYNWYGLPVKYIDFTESQIQSIDEKQTYNSFYLGGKLLMNESVFNGAEVYYKRFWDAHTGTENRFWLKPSFDIEVSDIKIKTDVIADYVGTNFDKSTTALATEINSSIFNFGVQPSLVYQQDDLALKIGVGLFYSAGKVLEESESKLYFYPQVQASYKVVGNLMIAYAGIEGGLKQNSYADFVDENPFIAPRQIIAPTDRSFDFYIGLKGKLADNMAYNLRGSYVNEKRKPLFYTEYAEGSANTQGYAFGNSMNIMYSDLRTFSLFGELKSEINQNISLFVNGTFNTFTTEDNQKAWYLPSIKLAAGVDANITDKVSLTANLYFVGKREALLIYDAQDPLIDTENKSISLDGYFDMNLGANYKYNERLGFFLKLNNLTDQKHETWANFPVQGIQILAGANYKFDF